MSHTFDFSTLKPHRETFVGPDGNVYTLTDATIDAGVAFRNANLGAAELSPEGKVQRWTGMADSERVLVGHCIFAGAEVANDAVPVGPDFIRRWPIIVLTRLYDRVIEVSPGLVPEKVAGKAPKGQPSGGEAN